MRTTPEQTAQIKSTLESLRGILGDALLAVYLHGSAVSGGLRPQSDIDFLVVVGREPTEDQRDDLLAALLRLSRRHAAAPEEARRLEVMMFRRSDLAESTCPARSEFIYGEWLRDAFEAGGKPVPAHDPEHTLVLAQARREAMPLFGPRPDTLLPEIPPEHVREAMSGALPAVLKGLRGDERNALLTLARMWRTAGTGAFVTKDAAAAWAIPRIRGEHASTLDHARRAYLGEITDNWSTRSDAARRLAAHLAYHVRKLL